MKLLLNRLAAITVLGSAVLFVSSCSLQEDPLSEVYVDTKEITYAGNIRISLAHPRDVATDKYELLFSSTKTTETMGLCESDKIVDCKPGQNFYYEVKKVDYETENRRFFKASAAAILETNLVLTVIAMDASGLVTDTRHIKFTDSSAGASQDATAQPDGSAQSVTGAGQGGPGTGQGGPTTNDAEIKTITQNMCGGAGCHQSYADNPASMKGGTSLTRIQNGTMPKGRVMAAAEKEALIRYLSTP